MMMPASKLWRGEGHKDIYRGLKCKKVCAACKKLPHVCKIVKFGLFLTHLKTEGGGARKYSPWRCHSYQSEWEEATANMQD